MAKTVFIIFMIFVPILLLNMLIAMMGNTYAAVIEQSEKEFVKQWAKIVVSLERAVPKEDAKKYLETYSIPLTEDERGVMVIKSKSKTRARQRKGAVGNWKRVLKVTLGELKKKGMSGEELRRIMWGRASITSPTKISKKKKREMDMANEDPFGLTAALDQMSYTQDILMMEQEEVVIDPVKKQPVQKAPPPDKAAGDNMVNLMSDLKDSQLPGTAPSTTPHTPKSGMSLSYSGGVELHATSYNDPLRELIILTENKDADPNDESFWSRLLRLAEEATLLDHIEEVKESLRLSEAQKQENKAAEVHAAVLFQNPKDIIDPVKEAEFMKTLQALVESDSDAEKPVLGKGSLVRRAKSAVSRRSSSKQRKTDDHPLFKIAWEEQQLSTGLFNYTYDDLKTPQDDTMMDVADQDYDEATVADEVIERDPEPRGSDVQSESSSVKSKSRRRRGRFGRNKISPTSSDDGDATGGQRRVKTAPPRESGQEADEDSPPDPLEPWSTRDLMNINQILDQNDSPLVGDEPVPEPQELEDEPEAEE